ncbi:alternative ribosome rescue aminoacyl-tRNA hydrolase ArfB [Chryseolinea lacunae]|uniref:Aminoacyl-tRNA hydrolase n=1 Tax=Chryseolinea lacunae TaxID=2801331 RepID=A0ABS1KLX6_9BACT|nr:alternative ribosome rescue aminoacyl-tRNA hydrolase ArfB [Chryseolinea lacunae]MBL0740333.1 aminoacyl-tRNA hydrolase [Chryseolinea lacunae]
MSAQRPITAALLGSELTFTTSRSSGPGGQNVNKVNTKVTLKFDVTQSLVLTPEEKEIIAAKLATKMTTDGVLIITSQDKRSQLQNKEEAVAKLDAWLTKAFAKKKARKATKPSKTSVQNRINKKKKASEKKQWRRRIE